MGIRKKSKWIVCVIYGNQPVISYQRFNRKDWEYYKKCYRNGELDLCYIAQTEILITDRDMTESEPVIYCDTLNLEKIEKAAIKKALRLTGGVQKDAARLLGISKRKLNYILNEKYKDLKDE